ncbi:MAG TPA: chromate efflux transporter [Chthoniobacterales bacterium]|nr:chromate efflux transporter [Chthoniobacterales bacterium]
MDTGTPEETREIRPTFGEALRFWTKLGFISFGGPAGQIAIMQTELVDKRRWITQPRFLHALNFCMLLPGPEAQQLAIYIGWLLHGTRGGIVAGVLFVLPSVFILWALSFVYAAYGNIPAIAAIFYGLKPVVMAIVAAAVVRIARKSLTHWLAWVVAAAAFIGIFVCKIPFPILIFAAALIGWGSGSFSKRVTSEPLAAPTGADTHRPAGGLPLRALRIGLTCGVLWWLPVLIAGALQGWDGTLFKQGIFFSKAAVVTFGGAYAVLPYVAQQAVEHYSWLGAGQMMDGLGLAETTPGPLIMVLQFVGFMGGWNQPGALTPLVAATMGALLTTWVTFVPCFLWIFLGAPHVEKLHGNFRLRSALAAVTAAVVGVILNLAVWFGMRVIFPASGGIDWIAIALGVVTFIGLVKWKWDVMGVVIGGGFCGLMLHFLRG